METIRQTVYNFNAGPSILPPSVIKEAAEAVYEYNGSGLSLLEIGHRTTLFGEILYEARTLVRELMELAPDQEVLFLHGGASTQFMQVPMNLLPPGGQACYTDTGVWAGKAVKEAKLFGKVHLAGSGKEHSYNRLPDSLDLKKGASYLHLTTNNTIYGTQWQDLSMFYQSGLPLVADMSSDILSRQLDFSRFALIYAGAQKNVGAAGVNLVVVNKTILGKAGREIPTILDYRQHIEAGSLLNTPPVFAIYTCLLTLRWLKSQGGVTEIETVNNRKASLLYETLDALPIFEKPVYKPHRSRMNVVFRLSNEMLEKSFLEFCAENGIVGIKGHRLAGGFRVSLYNALPFTHVEVLIDILRHFAHKHA